MRRSTGRGQLKQDPLYSKLDVAKATATFHLADDRVYDAASFASPAMRALIKELVPRLAAAADGDPETSTAQR